MYCNDTKATYTRHRELAMLVATSSAVTVGKCCSSLATAALNAVQIYAKRVSAAWK
jgi:hypothetical protein